MARSEVGVARADVRPPRVALGGGSHLVGMTLLGAEDHCSGVILEHPVGHALRSGAAPHECCPRWLFLTGGAACTAVLHVLTHALGVFAPLAHPRPPLNPPVPLCHRDLCHGPQHARAHSHFHGAQEVGRHGTQVGARVVPDRAVGIAHVGGYRARGTHQLEHNACISVV